MHSCHSNRSNSSSSIFITTDSISTSTSTSNYSHNTLPFKLPNTFQVTKGGASSWTRRMNTSSSPKGSVPRMTMMTTTRMRTTNSRNAPAPARTLTCWCRWKVDSSSLLAQARPGPWGVAQQVWRPAPLGAAKQVRWMSKKSTRMRMSFSDCGMLANRICTTEKQVVQRKAVFVGNRLAATSPRTIPSKTMIPGPGMRTCHRSSARMAKRSPSLQGGDGSTILASRKETQRSKTPRSHESPRLTSTSSTLIKPSSSAGGKEGCQTATMRTSSALVARAPAAKLS
mmetsp:Transcript_15718/g.50108  ORF Transcript_15718/g.50108 Transcript_15718/m.50108 type:complete len:284 (-) Transcript_15718:424-1275(-)